ncbi:MAG: PAS domain S-box protein [Syntrophobacteraceae bacterium]
MDKPQRGFRLSIRSRIFVLLLVTILPVAVLQAWAHYSHFQKQRKAALQADLEIARSVNAAFTSLVNDLFRADYSIGLVLAHTGISPEDAQAILRKNLDEFPAVRAFSWVSPDGLILASTMNAAVSADVSNRDYFLEISSGKTVYMSDIRASMITGEPMISVARGMRSDQGELMGIVHAAVLPERLSQILTIKRAGSAVVMVLDGKGQIVVCYPRAGWAYRGQKFLAENPVVLGALAGNELVTEIDFGPDGMKRVMALSPIRSIGWVAVSARAEEEIRGPILRDFYLDMGILLLFAVAILFFAFGVSRAIATPIQELRTRIASLADGRKNQPLIIEGPPEIMDLTETFNQMAEEIHARETERFEHLARMRLLLEVSVEILSETTVEGLLQKIVDASRAVTHANLAVAGLKEDDAIGIGAVSRAEGIRACPPIEMFRVHRGGVYSEIMDTGLPIRHSDAEMREHPLWNGPPEGHGPLRGILGAPLRDLDGSPSGLVMVTDKKAGEFEQGDEAILTQLAAIASLGIQHVQARDRAEKGREQLKQAHDVLELRVRERTVELAEMNVQLVREIDERKRAEEQLRLSEELYRLLTDNVRQFIFTMAPDGNIDYCNRFWTEYTGLPAEAAFGDRWMRVVHPDDLRPAGKIIARYAASGRPFRFELRLKEGATGGYRWFVVRNIPLGYREGKVSKWLGTAVDIDDRKTLEEALNKRRQEFQALAENAPDIVLRFDRELRLSYANPALWRVLGGQAKPPVGKRAVELGVGDDIARAWEENLERVFRTGEECSFEFELPGKAGRAWFEARLAPELSRTKAVESVLAICRDVTERILAREKRRLYTARLEQSNRDLEAFAAIASHDLQEPMRKVQAFGDRLEKKYRGKLDEEGLDYIRRMQAASGRMQTMIRSLLNFYRLSTAVRPMADIDLRKILKQVVRDLEAVIEQKNARVEIGDLPVIEADPDQMRHLFQNLVGNSLKFSGDKEPLIRISARETPPPPDKDMGRPWYEIVVEDNGIGIEEEYLERIFGLFERLHGRSAYEGSGMGLAICRKVVERHNGLITARSQPGKGAEFMVSLPRRQPEEWRDRAVQPETGDAE